MTSLPISREKAIELLKKWPQTDGDMNHYLESEAVMRELALHLNEDVEYYGMLGLLHDIDWVITKENTKEHMTKAPEILKKAGFNKEFIEIIVSHTYGFDCADSKDKIRTKKIEYALAASETITGLIYSYALMRGKKISDMEVKGLKKKFQDKAFAAGCDREIIREAEKLGISLEEFFEIAIKGIKKIKDNIGLS
jgi:putative nucleotidyltransferase with HDIG domain